MRTKDQELLTNIQQFIEEHCDKHGYGPSVRAVANEFGISSSCAHKYMEVLGEQGRIAKGRNGYESIALARSDRAMNSIPIVGVVPCGPLTECDEYIEGYIRLPESLIGQGKFYLFNATGTAMIDAGIDDGDLVLVRQQDTAEVGDIVVALADNENTLKRLEYNERKGRYYLHPENETMEDIYVENLAVQGVAVKVLKDLI